MEDVASVIAWVMWLDSLLNVFENLSFLHVLQTLDRAYLVPIMGDVFAFRTATLVAGFVCAVAFHCVAFGNQRVTNEDGAN